MKLKIIPCNKRKYQASFHKTGVLSFTSSASEYIKELGLNYLIGTNETDLKDKSIYFIPSEKNENSIKMAKCANYFYIRRWNLFESLGCAKGMVYDVSIIDYEGSKIIKLTNHKN